MFHRVILENEKSSCVPGPDDMELPFRTFPKRSEDGEVTIYIRDWAYMYDERKDFEEKVTQMEKNLRSEKRRWRWDAEDQERDEL